MKKIIILFCIVSMLSISGCGSGGSGGDGSSIQNEPISAVSNKFDEQTFDTGVFE